jgi:hypothetical protein
VLDGATSNVEVMHVRRRHATPAPSTTRPSEPIRPLPAQRTGVSLLALRARRRRHRGSLPGRSG